MSFLDKGGFANPKPGEPKRKQKERFLTELAPGALTFVLWEAEGGGASTIKIEKEIHINIDGKGDGLGDGRKYPVYHVRNNAAGRYSDPSNPVDVTPEDQPLTDFEEALALAEQCYTAALQSGQWKEA